jgi:acyl-CoA synthetase (AMP-forming)/AMP-acid ligase II
MVFDNLVQMAAQGCRSYPNVPAVIFEDGLTITREQLLSCAQKFAGYLLQHTAEDDRIAVMLENRIECMIIFFAALLARRTLVTINPTSKAHDAAHVLHNSGSVMIIASEAQKLLIKSLRTECTALSLVLIVRDVETGI